jgi:hypothetical protein
VSGPATAVAVAGGPLAAPVLGRVVAAMAAAADLGIDRVCDARLVGEALAAHGSGQTLDGRVRLSVEQGRGSLKIRVGPLIPGGAAALLGGSSLTQVGTVLQGLVDEVGVEAERGAGEHLTIRLVAPA